MTTTVNTSVPETANQAPIAIVTETKPAIMDANAWMRYNQPNVLAGLPMRRFLPLNILYKIVEVLRRFRGAEYSMTWEDLTWLVQFDGDKTVKCTLCGREFHPLKWVLVTERFLKCLAQVKGDLSQAVLKGGAYLIVADEVHPLCGPLYYYGPNAKLGGEFMIPNTKSCVGKAYTHEDNKDLGGIPLMPHSLEEAGRILEERRKAASEVARADHLRDLAAKRQAQEDVCKVNLGALFAKAKAHKAAGQKK